MVFFIRAKHKVADISHTISVAQKKNQHIEMLSSLYNIQIHSRGGEFIDLVSSSAELTLE